MGQISSFPVFISKLEMNTISKIIMYTYIILYIYIYIVCIYIVYIYIVYIYI